ncbi:hypothetical protein COS83_00165 [archaeon CG07_land_8_20_14_0_80_38_8]|nr:MAG: hypothetical protein COS83_00165 [archaeon CG07_land_8_20_14_0_80_38_8]PIU88739.1 MAG: hypothetical protein COS64_02530 [archaeon CG06_land_8_20_14_3_00_37_11]
MFTNNDKKKMNDLIEEISDSISDKYFEDEPVKELVNNNYVNSDTLMDFSKLRTDLSKYEKEFF